MSGVRYQVLAKTNSKEYVVHVGVRLERSAKRIAKDELKKNDVMSTQVVKLTNGVKVKRELVIEFDKGKDE